MQLEEFAEKIKKRNYEKLEAHRRAQEAQRDSQAPR
jgi:hypothetical protein